MSARDLVRFGAPLALVLAGTAVPLEGCASGRTAPAVAVAGGSPRTDERGRPSPADVQLFFRGDQPFARRGEEEWPLSEVKKGEMIFSPDKRKFAFVREKGAPPESRSAKASAALLAAQAGAAGPPASGAPPAQATPKAAKVAICVRNLAGDPINEFPVYRPGRPEEVSWLDDRRLGYVAPPEPVAPKGRRSSQVYVVHDVQTGEVLAARAGLEFIWGPETGERRHVAFVSGAIGRQVVVVDGQNVWPRHGASRIKSGPVWSPDGHGLAFTEETSAGPRLVVLVEFDDAQGDLTWNIPNEATGLGVFWAGDSKVVIGETALRPRFSADWQRLR